MRLKDRVAIVTGSGSGIGRAGARIFAQEGARVIVADIDEQRGRETEKLIQETGGDALFFQTDVSQSFEVERLVRGTLGRYKRLDIVWNNAATTQLASDQDRPVHELSEEVWDRMLNVALKGVFLCSKFALPHMMASRKGIILNTSSVDALVGQGGYDSYTAAKGGIVSLTRSMAVYYSKYNIRVNCICPGFVCTPATESWLEDPKIRPSIERLHLTRVGTADDIAKFALYLASDDAEYVTGGIFPIDGGFTAFKTHITDYSAEIKE